MTPALEACPPSKPSSLPPAPLETCHRFQFEISLTPTENSVRVPQHRGETWEFRRSAPTAGELPCSEMPHFSAAAYLPWVSVSPRRAGSLQLYLGVVDVLVFLTIMRIVYALLHNAYMIRIYVVT